MSTNEIGFSCSKDTGRAGLSYLEALSDARAKLMDGYSKDDAIAYASDKHNLSKEDWSKLFTHIHKHGAFL